MAPSPGELYRGVRQRIGIALTEAAGAGALDDRPVDDRPVPTCPAWTVAQLTAHLAGTTAALVARDRPGADVQAWVDGHVADRAGRTARENWAEWDAAGPAFEALLDAHEAAYGSLLFDAIVHEGDLAAALGHPAPRDADAVAYGLGRLGARADHEARRRGLGTLVLVTHAGEHRIGDGEPQVTWRVDDGWEAMRALCSRRSAAQLAALGFVDELAPWRAVLPYGLPAHDLVEG